MANRQAPRRGRGLRHHCHAARNKFRVIYRKTSDAAGLVHLRFEATKVPVSRR
jgi:hypothetical protein